MKKWLIFPLIVLLSACVSAPEGLERDEFTIQSLRQIEDSDYVCQCKKVRLGGKIISAEALKNQTKLEILSLPITTYSAKPVIESATDGRFIAYLDGFADPASLKDQYITVAGILKEQWRGKIDEADYLYPIIKVTAYKQWRLAKEYYYEYDDWHDYRFRRFGHFRHWGWDPFWRPELKLRYRLY
ncbi:Slp family lipoprotein [Basfia succiniciproducens]|uniref:Slp family lipoprotein n=1 Tax=Basfia succiniciproducens TaxID=653940 RepID=UPI0008D1A875|nr:Slp family lipoprotein [Basfia succiniciproducens]SEQ51097.1 outer membrane lipoprotein [Basfia succiniciproducens]